MGIFLVMRAGGIFYFFFCQKIQIQLRFFNVFFFCPKIKIHFVFIVYSFSKFIKKNTYKRLVDGKMSYSVFNYRCFPQTFFYITFQSPCLFVYLCEKRRFTVNVLLLFWRLLCTGKMEKKKVLQSRISLNLEGSILFNSTA